MKFKGDRAKIDNLKAKNSLQELNSLAPYLFFQLQDITWLYVNVKVIWNV